MKTHVGQYLKLIAFVLVLLFSAASAQKHRNRPAEFDDPTGMLTSQLTSAVQSQLGPEYRVGFQVLDSVIA